VVLDQYLIGHQPDAVVIGNVPVDVANIQCLDGATVGVVPAVDRGAAVARSGICIAPRSSCGVRSIAPDGPLFRIGGFAPSPPALRQNKFGGEGSQSK
jgi:hypothetical protein